MRLRALGALGGLALTLVATPAFAATPPAPPTSFSSAVGDRFVDLSWTGGSGTGAIVRDVTGLSAPYSTTSGRDVPATAATAHDTGFTNTTTATYAVFTTEDDGTPSDSPLVADVPVAPLVPTDLSLATSTTTVPWGRAVAFTGTLRRAGTAPVPSVPVDLMARTLGTSAFRAVRSLSTGVDGSVSTALPPSRSSEFYLRFGGDAFSAASESPHQVVDVLPRTTITVTPPAIVRGETAVLSGRVVPTLPGAPLYVQRLSGKTWANVALLKLDSASAFRLTLAPGLGIYRYRVVLVKRPAYLGLTSGAVQLRVDARDLRSGLTGDDVLALQQRLKALHYEPGAVNGSFGYDLTHAVMAFQKVERLPVTGVWTRAERVRAGHPTAWSLRFPKPGRAVEVDITRQVLVLSEAGKVARIIDVSTGTEKPYTYKGESDVAHTPRGAFSVYYKIDGIRVSKLGELYKPSYFYKGWAIHGSGSVPSYPASHGCVRITNPNADRLFPLLVKGTPVTLYDE